jgi:hypothetical protein
MGKKSVKRELVLALIAAVVVDLVKVVVRA